MDAFAVAGGGFSGEDWQVVDFVELADQFVWFGGVVGAGGWVFAHGFAFLFWGLVVVEGGGEDIFKGGGGLGTLGHEFIVEYEYWHRVDSHLHADLEV